MYFPVPWFRNVINDCARSCLQVYDNQKVSVCTFVRLVSSSMQSCFNSDLMEGFQRVCLSCSRSAGMKVKLSLLFWAVRMYFGSIGLQRRSLPFWRPRYVRTHELLQAGLPYGSPAGIWSSTGHFHPLLPRRLHWLPMGSMETSGAHGAVMRLSPVCGVFLINQYIQCRGSWIRMHNIELC